MPHILVVLTQSSSSCSFYLHALKGDNLVDTLRHAQRNGYEAPVTISSSNIRSSHALNSADWALSHVRCLMFFWSVDSQNEAKLPTAAFWSLWSYAANLRVTATPYIEMCSLDPCIMKSAVGTPSSDIHRNVDMPFGSFSYIMIHVIWCCIIHGLPGREPIIW